MRCEECRTDPAAESHYCECCGNLLPGRDDTREVVEEEGRSMRCESCGGPAGDGNLCLSCQRAFHELLDDKWRLAHSSQPAGPASGEELAQEIPSPELVSISALFDEAVSRQDEPWMLTAEVVRSSETAPVEAPAPAPMPMARGSAGQLSLAFEVPPDNDGQSLAPPSVAASSPASDVIKAPSASVTTMDSPAVSVPAKSRPRSSWLMLTAAASAIVIAAIGFPLASMVVGGPAPAPASNRTSESARSVKKALPAPEQQARSVDPTPAAELPPTSPAVSVQPVQPKAVAAAFTAVATSSVRPVATKPRPPVMTPRVTAASKPTPRPLRAAPQSASIADTSPAIAAAEVAAPPPEVALPAPPPETVAAPLGPFFEMRDVGEQPQVVARVEPQVPDALRGSVNEIVVLRVLVSQSGHPSLVRLLRGSKSGPILDDAVVAAVRQWRFAPARRRGEAVSCWYHVGVPVRRME